MTQTHRLQQAQGLLASGVKGGLGLLHFQVEIDLGNHRLQLGCGRGRKVFLDLTLHPNRTPSIHPDVLADFGQQQNFLLLTDAKALKQKRRLAPGAVQLNHVHANAQLPNGHFDAVTGTSIRHTHTPQGNPLIR